MKLIAAAVAGVAIACCVGYVGNDIYTAGYTTSDAEWQRRWAQRDQADSKALENRQREERDEEQRRAQQAAAAAKQAEDELSEVRADAAAANVAAGGLRQAAESLAKRLADSQARCDTPIASQRAAAARASVVLADVLGRIDAPAGELAKEADDRRIRGKYCENIYGTLHKEQ